MIATAGHGHDGALGGIHESPNGAPATAAERLQALLRPDQEAKV